MDSEGGNVRAALPEQALTLGQALGEAANGLASPIFFIMKTDHSRGSRRWGVA